MSPDLGIALVQLYQQVVATPVIIGEAIVVFVIPPEVYIAVPVPVGGVLPVFPDILEGKEIPAGMIKDAVKDDLYALGMTILYKVLQVFVIPQAGVQLSIVGGLIAVSHGLKEGPYIDGVTAQGLYMGDPGPQPPQPVYRLPVRILPGCPQKTQWVNVIEYGFVVPCHKDTSVICIGSKDSPRQAGLYSLSEPLGSSRGFGFLYVSRLFLTP